MENAFVKIEIYFFVRCSQTNAIFAKSQNFTRIKDAQIIDKAFKYADCYLHIGCH